MEHKFINFCKQSKIRIKILISKKGKHAWNNLIPNVNMDCEQLIKYCWTNIESVVERPISTFIQIVYTFVSYK